MTASVLVLPDFTKPFTIDTDASNIGIGAILSQNGHPMAFLSKAVGPKAQALSTYEKECLAVILAVTKWKQYLQHKEFSIATGHKSLIHLTKQKLHEGLQRKAFIKLLGLQYKIVYKKVPDNKVADALSRQSEATQLFVVSTCTLCWLEIIVEGYSQDDQAKQLLSELSLTGSNEKGFTLVDGTTRFVRMTDSYYTVGH